MKSFRVVWMFVVAVVFSASASGQDLPSTKVLTFNLAQTIAQAAMAKCRAEGHKISVVVVDPLNYPVVVLRDDGSVPANLDFAKMKALGAILYRTPTGPAQPLPPGAPLPASPLPGTWMSHGGGVPIKAGEYTIGAIGVGGTGTGEGDAVCANAGVAKVADKLK
jgi:uncharacterized protein GlcG (DUF336 family)